MKNPLTPDGIEPAIFRFVAQHLNHCGYRGPHIYIYIYRVIHMSLRDFRPLRYSSREGHAEGEHVNRRTGTPIFCPTLQVLDMSTLGDVADVNPVIKFLPHTTRLFVS